MFRSHRSSLIRRTIAPAAVAAALALAPAVVATTWIRLGAKDLTAQSEIVAVGIVTSRVAEEISVPWFEDPAGDMIYTRYEMRVERGLKGAKPGDVISFVSMGGRIGDRSVDVAGAPHFRVGEKIVGGFFRNVIERLQPHWGGVSTVVATRRGDVAIGQPGHTIETNVLLADAVHALEGR